MGLYSELSNAQAFAYKGYQVILTLEKSAFFSDKKTWSINVTISPFTYEKIAQAICNQKQSGIILMKPDYSATLNSLRQNVSYYRTFQIETRVGGLTNSPAVQEAIRITQSLIDRECGDVLKRFERVLGRQ